MSSLGTAPPADPAAAVASQATKPGRGALKLRGHQIRAVVAPLVVFVAFIVLWQNEFFHNLFGLETFAVPLPERIVDAFSEDASRLREAFGETFIPAMMGYAAGNLLGFLLALALMTLPPALGRRGSALGSAVAALPIMAVAPIVALWIGSELWFKTVTVMIIVFPSMLVYAYRGMTAVDPTALELMDSYRASSMQVLRVLRLPNAVPHIFTALKYTTVLTLVAAVICEILRAHNGLGFEIHESLVSFGTPRAWAAVVLLGLTGIVLYVLLLLVERIGFPWALRQESP
jgi:NitT/TauT family transport system permease protein